MKISEFLSKNFQFSVVKCSMYFNRRVFVIIPVKYAVVANDSVGGQ